MVIQVLNFKLGITLVWNSKLVLPLSLKFLLFWVVLNFIEFVQHIFSCLANSCC